MPAAAQSPAAQAWIEHGSALRENLKLTRTILLRMAAVAVAALAPLVAGAQASPDAGQTSERSEATYKYQAYAGAAYTRIRQVPISYSGLVGGRASLARDWGKYFQLIASGDYYKLGTGQPGLATYGNPSVFSILGGPGIHMDLFGGLSGQFFLELGAEHTGGESMSPSTSVAGGFGGSLTYSLNRRWGVRLTGDRVGGSFPEPNNMASAQAGSTHRTWNVRATMGLVYRF
jgi:hypothetical protein